MTDDEKEEKKDIAEEVGKRLAWELLDASHDIHNMSAYARTIIRKQNDCSLLRINPSKELIVRYNINSQRGYINYVWWLLEQVEKGNVTIKEDAQPKS